MNRLDGGSDTYRELFAAGTCMILRGDEGFGWKPVAQTETGIGRTMELLLCGEIPQLKPHLAAFGLDGHAFPPSLERRSGETIDAWRDRLYHSFRIPTVLAAFNEGKAGHFDLVNPLVSRRALEITRSLPDDLRTDKRLFRELVARLGPDVPFATSEGAPIRLDSLRRPEVRRILRACLASETAARCFGRPLVTWLRAGIHPWRDFAARISWGFRKRLHRRLRPGTEIEVHVPLLRIAFRIYIATTMVDRLEADAARFGPPPLPAEGRVPAPATT
jgi:hypothetical protein